MELKFSKKPLHCLRPFFSKIHTQEQTQEIRLPDAYPDIGKIIGCWGQVLMRGKEWRTTSMGANGGVMAWVMYAPEDGTQNRVLDVWIPIQCRWDFSQSADDGIIMLNPVLSNLDGRSISARKIMMRAVVDTFAQALGKQTMLISQTPQVPEDVQLLTRVYPVDLPMEAGEKQIQMEEILAFPSDLPPIHKFVRYRMNPSVSEQKVLGNRLVFRGQAGIDMSYMTEDGTIHNWKTEIPFSQYTELEQEFSPGATAWVLPLVTAMELEMSEDQQLQMRGGIAAQYTVFDRNMIEVVEDAFSPRREITPQMENIQPPALLDNMAVEIPVEGNTELIHILDAMPMAQYPQMDVSENEIGIRLNGQFQIMGMDMQEQLTGDSVRFEGNQEFQSASANQSHVWLGCADGYDVATAADGQMIRTKYPATLQIYSGQSIPMVTQLEIGEERPADPDRPSLILRRAGDEDLWAIAKACGSTVAAIRIANQLEEEPESGRMLLIPVV